MKRPSPRKLLVKAAKKYPIKCATKFCRNRVGKAEKSPICGKCRARRWKERHPLRYSFNKLRYRAKERGHVFKLTFEQYQRFALASGYAENKGKTAESFSIDRIDPERGYELDNIRCVTLSENSRLRFVTWPGKSDNGPEVHEETDDRADADDGDCVYVEHLEENEPF